MLRLQARAESDVDFHFRNGDKLPANEWHYVFCRAMPSRLVHRTLRRRSALGHRDLEFFRKEFPAVEFRCISDTRKRVTQKQNQK